MKEGLIRITGMPDVFYDRVEKLYRYRMHCPTCGKYSGCRCFPSLEDAIDACEEGNDCTDTYKCTLIWIAKNEGWDEVLCTMNGAGMGWKWKIKAFVLNVGLFLEPYLRYKSKYWISEKDCGKYLDEVDYDYDEITGEFC